MKKSKYATFLCDLIFKPNPKALFLNFVFYAVEGIMLPLAAWSFGAFIDSITGGGDNLRFYLGIYLFATVSQVLFVKFSQYVRENSIYSIQQYVDKLICGYLVKSKFDYIDSEEYRKKFSVAKKTNHNIYSFFTYMMDGISTVIGIIASLIAVMQGAAWIGLLFLCILLCELPIYKRMSFQAWNDFQQEDNIIRKVDYFINLFFERKSRRDIRGNDAGQFFLKKINTASDELFAAGKIHLKRMNFKMVLIRGLTLIVPVAAGIYSLSLYYHGLCGVGNVISLIAISKGLHSYVHSLGTIYKNLINSGEALKNSYDVIFGGGEILTDEIPTDEIPTDDVLTDDVLTEDVSTDGISTNKENGKLIDNRIKSIQFKNVSFKYPDAQSWTIKDLSFAYEGNGILGIVGQNGAGKTTIVKLLLGLYDNYKGAILINGISLRKMSCEEKNKLFSVCFQDYICPHLLLREALSISDIENINNDLLLTNVINRIDGVGNLENKLDGQLGMEYSGGMELSQGQWQKLAVGRALIPNRGGLIFDEPLASLDVYSEKKYYEQLDNLKGSVSILISHRMRGLKKCDKILVMEEGRIIEEGSHEELMEKRGLYYRMSEA